MKKITLFASALLTLGALSSCVKYDNPIEKETFVIQDGDGNKYETDLIATFQGEVGQEVSLGLGVYDRFDIYGVDFGDGNIVVDTVCLENKGLTGEDGLTMPGTTHTSFTKFTGTVAGDGTVKVYGKSDVWYMNLTGGLMPTSFDQAKLLNVAQVSIAGADVESIALPELGALKQFSFNNSSLKTIDVSKATQLTSLTINSTTVSKFEPQLEGIDVSQLKELTYLSLQGNNNASGKLTTIDLTQNTKLESVYLQYNQLSEVKLADSYEKLTVFNGQNNQLESFDASKVLAMKSLYLADNKLTTIDVSQLANLAWLDVKNNQLTGDLDLTANQKFTNVYVNNNQLTSVKVTDVTKQFYFDTNRMTIATMPAKPASMNTASKTKQYHYAPQADMEVTLDGATLDLSAQAKAKGLLEEEVATTFTVKAGDATLAADADYTIANGKITFLKSQKGVVVEMTTEAFPNLTLKTVAFDVEVGAASAALFSFDAGTANGGTVTVPEGSANSVDTEIKVASKKAAIDTDYVLITLNEELKAGDVISMTGYRKKDNDANGNLYILFEKGASIDEGNDVKWNNIHEAVGQQPNTNTYEVSAEAAGSKTIKLARSKSGTNVFIQKIEITRK